MPVTTLVVHEDVPLDSVGQWTELIEAGSGTAQRLIGKSLEKKTKEVTKRIEASAFKAAQAGEKAESVTSYTRRETPALHYVLAAVGGVAVLGIVLVLVLK